MLIHMRISAPVLFGRARIAPIMIGLTQRHGKLELGLRFSDHFVDLVEDRINLTVRISTLPDRAAHIAQKLGCFGVIARTTSSYFSTHGALPPPTKSCRDMLACPSTVRHQAPHVFAKVTIAIDTPVDQVSCLKGFEP
ncbi:hypothetical protein [Rhizobium sp. A37_96]